MGIQELITFAIVLACMAWVGRKFFLFFKHADEKKDPCANCVNDCKLKHINKEKSQSCQEKPNVTKKSGSI